MASHGILRSATREVRTAEARQKELQEIESYQNLVSQIQKGIEQKDFSPELLEKTSALLRKNPEYYTIWNIRRTIFEHEFSKLTNEVKGGQLTEDSKHSQILDIINLDLHFLFPLLLQYPKCYWIWNHRIWLLQQATAYLRPEQARSLWQEELQLVAKMLTRDSRNFHGWGYRRTVIASLEDARLGGKSLTREEYDYTTKMIRQNLSNFSAWHNRTQLILRMLDEQQASAAERKQMLDAEIHFIHEALFDPFDQSLWFYHQNLMSTFDADLASQSLAPDLTDEQRLVYIQAEQDFIQDLVEDAEDSKWVYQALIECAVLKSKLKRELSAEAKSRIQGWLEKLKQLDQLRIGRWVDTEQKLLGPK